MYYIIAGVLMTSVGYAMLVVPGIPPLLLATAAIVALTIGEMLTLPFINTIVMRRAHEKSKGKYAAAYALSWSIAQIAGPGGGALIIQKWGYPVLWMTMVVVCVACAVTFNILSKKSTGHGFDPSAQHNPGAG